MSFSDQISSLLFVLIIVQVTRHIDLTNPIIINYVRATYLTVQCLLFATSYYIYRRIKSISDKSKISVTEPAKPFTNDPPVVKEMTVEEYDEGKIKEYLKESLIALLILSFLHWKYEFVQPLLIQSVLRVKSAFSLPIIQIHVFRKEPNGPLQRPFKPPANPFAQAFENVSNNSSNEDDLTKTEKKKLKKAAAAAAATVNAAPVIIADNE